MLASQSHFLSCQPIVTIHIPKSHSTQKRVIFNKKRKRGKTLGPFFLSPFFGLSRNLASRYRGLYLTICYFQICGFLVKVFSEGSAMIIVKCN